MLELKLNWILYGFKGVGKSTFAKRLPLPAVDTDHLIEQKMGIPVPAFVQKHGWEALRAAELELLANLQLNQHVISVGGSTPLDSKNLSELKRLGKLIHLAAPKNLIRKRQLSPPLPLFIDPSDPDGSFERMWSQRITEYERIEDYRVEIDQKSDLEILEELWQLINLEISFASLHGENPTEKPSVS